MDHDHSTRSAPSTDSASSSPTSRLAARSGNEVCPPSRELAERTSNGTLVRLLWRHGTTQLWVELREPETELALRIPVQPEQALDAFHHPYAYAGARTPQPARESPDACVRLLQQEHHEQ